MSRHEEFQGGRFYDRFHDFMSAGWRYRAGFEDGNNERAYVESSYTPDRHQQYPGGPDAEYAHDEDGQGVLLHSTPSRHTVERAFSTKGARHQVPTLLGMAGVTSMRKQRELPGASNNLSPHSAKLVQKLVDRGLIKNPTGGNTVRASNAGDFGTSDGSTEADVRWLKVDAGDQEASPQSVAAGRQFTRQLLRRSSRKSVQQTPLPGMP